MACSVVKKVVLGTAIAVGASALIFGTSAPSYFKTAFHKVRHRVKSSVPMQFEIDRARQQVADLEPAIHENIENYARAEADVEHLKQEMVAIRDNLGVEKQTILALRKSLETGDFQLTGSVSYTPDEVKSEMARRWDHYRQVERILHEKNETLKARERAMAAARGQLASISSQRKSLLTKIDEIEARLKAIEATQSTNEFTFDDSALARAKQSVAELDNRLDVMARTAELEGRYADGKIPVVIEPKRDVVKEVDEAFGKPTVKSTEPGEKSL